ncbi:DUF2235 domain-containing protein [uncultured Chryseobacterium sp.]|uniref:phospholipase effector Tle1 domain-containing protein n=1 Tax=uncultured Chryseobacterium sp. TaxID=259322 RepID=UPI0025D8AEA5|nr:DUF2235 domain-containing protein [uncultured Chryseobacterium sp.]
MSIEYIIEGKTVIRTSGDYKTYAKEEIIHNSAVSVEQKGNETGVSYNPAEKINPNDKPVNTIDVTLNLFFDGTQNNKTNTQAGARHENSNHVDDSYTNDYSNVARGYDAVDPNAENQIRVYIEGIGTEDLQSESIPFTTKPNNIGIPFGTGDRGVPAKVSKGCKNSSEALAKYAGKDIHLKVNVYGFSRGATAARHFVHIATKAATVLRIDNKKGMALAPFDNLNNRVKVDLDNPLVTQYGYFGACLVANKVIPKNISFNFVGLYDTVAAYGMDHRGKKVGNVSIIDDDTAQLGLDSVNKAYFILQLAADDEHRDNFDLTNIKRSGVKGLEFTLPGVHSDIGGCYVDLVEENVDLYKEEINNTECKRFREILIEEGWYIDDPKQIWIERLTPHVHGVDSRFILKGKRKPRNIYDKVSLNTMFHYSEHFKVIYKKNSISDHKIQDSFLSKIYNQLLGYMNACNNLRNEFIEEYNKTNSSGDYVEKLKTLNYEEYVDQQDLKILRNQYLHWSASVTKLGLGPRIGKVTSAKERKRNIQDG